MHKTSVVNSETVTDPTLREILEGLAGRIRRDDFTLNSTSRNKIITGMLMNHVDVQLRNYKEECKRSKVPEVERRYRVIEAMYLLPDKKKASEIAEEEAIEQRTVYATLEKAFDDLSILFFGVQGMESVEMKRSSRRKLRQSRKKKVGEAASANNSK